MTGGVINCLTWRCWKFLAASSHCLLWTLSLLMAAQVAEGDTNVGGNFIRTPQSQIVALADKDAILRCDFDYPGGRPVSHIIEWSKRGHDVPIFILYQGYPPHVGEGYEGRLALAGESGEKASLLIKNIQRDDEGWYECKVQLLNRPPETPKNGSWVYLLVHAPPQITAAPPWEIYVKQNDEVQLSCDATGTPKPKISWIKDGDPIRETPRIILTATSLTIRSVSTADVGTYECAAKNTEGRVSRTSKLIIASGAVILRPPENMTRLDGDRADLHCKAEGRPNNLTFHWLRDNTPILPSYYSELSSRVVVQTDGTLIINPTSKTDTGKYTCRVTNGIEETPEASAWLSIQFPARITYNPSLQYLPVNLSGLIRCFIESHPAVQFVHWTKDNRVLDIKALPGVSALSNGSLFIERVTMDHQGQYTCTPYNAHGTSGSSIDMNVLVEEPPVFEVIPKQFYQAEQKATVTIVCAAKEPRGKPKPKLTWRRSDGAPMSERTSIQGGILTLYNVKKSDYGSYDCVLENDVATLVATTTLLIESTTPHAPTNVTVDVGPFSARIKWQPAYNGGFAQHYVIWHRVLGASSRQWRTLRVRPDDATSFTIYNLSPDTVYEFQVLSRNQLGDGMFSDTVIVRTPELDSYATVFPTDASGSTYVPTIVKPSGSRPGSPQEVVAAPNPEGIRVHWQPPRNSSVPIMYYVVEYRKAGEPWGISSDPIVDGRTFYMVRDAKAGNTYEFRVYAFTLTSFSEPSEIKTFMLSSDFSGNLSPTIAITAGVVGGILFFVISIVLAFVCIKCAKCREKRERYEASAAHRPGSPVPLKRGDDRFKTRGIRGLKSIHEALKNQFCPVPKLTRQRHDSESTSRKPLYKRGYSVQVEFTEPVSEKPGSAMSGASSEWMTNRPSIRSFQHKMSGGKRPNPLSPETVTESHSGNQSVAIDFHEEPREPPYYITYTPTRSDIYQDYLDASGQQPMTPPVAYDRERLHVTIQRLRDVVPNLNENIHEPFETADSGVNVASNIGNCDELSPSNFPDNVSSELTREGASADHSPPVSAVYRIQPLGSQEVSTSADEHFEFDMRVSPPESEPVHKSKETLRRSRSAHSYGMEASPLYKNTDARCQMLIKELREYKRRRFLSQPPALPAGTNWPKRVLPKKPLESEC